MVYRDDRFICSICRKCFGGKKEGQLACESCESKEKYADMREKKGLARYRSKRNIPKCIECSTEIVRSIVGDHSSLIGCCSGKCADLQRERIKKHSTQEKNKLANEKWLSNKKRKKSKYSLSQVMRMQEHKRLYGSDSWDHYLKNRRWDRI